MTGATIGTRADNAISIRELERMMLDIDVPDSEIRPYLRLETADGSAFGPRVQVDPAMVEEPAAESAVALASLNSVARWRRQQRYRRKIRGWTGLRVVAEGDSWFQYPFLIDDVVDHLFDEVAIYCLSGAGDLLGDMVRQDELTAAIASERPHIVLLSGGGNDLLGGGRLAGFLHPFAPGRDAADYLKPEFAVLLAETVESYRQIFRRAAAQGVHRVICHSYDHAIPRDGRWLGRPLASIGIVDPLLQRRIVGMIVDRFHAALVQAARDPEFRNRVVVADCRGLVPREQWHDELHPTDRGFAKVAARIRAAMQSMDETVLEAPGTAFVPFAAEAAGRRKEVVIAEAALGLTDYTEETLMIELGRRAEILRVDPSAASAFAMPVALSSQEGIFDGLGVLGRRIADRLHRELYGLICGSDKDDTADRERLRRAFGLGEASVIAAIATALTAGLGVAPLIAPVAAAIIYRRGIRPGWQETCIVWGEWLNIPGMRTGTA